MIVAVKDLDLAERGPDKLHRRPLKEDPPVGLIGIVHSRRRIRVDAVSPEEVFIPDEENLHAGGWQCGAIHLKRAGIPSRKTLESEPLEID